MSEYRQNDFRPEEQKENEVTMEESAATVAVKPQKPSLASSVLDTLEMFIFALCAVILVLVCVFRLCTVTGASMEDTFYGGEKLVVYNLFYTPQREDVIVFHQTGPDASDLNEPLVKRVIATEGETISISYTKDTMTVSITDINGKVTVLEEDYIKYEGRNIYGNETLTVPEGHVFVMGDNRNNSKDSRHPQIECVDERRILGKVVFRLTPFSRMGFID